MIDPQWDRIRQWAEEADAKGETEKHAAYCDVLDLLDSHLYHCWCMKREWDEINAPPKEEADGTSSCWQCGKLTVQSFCGRPYCVTCMYTGTYPPKSE